MSEVFSHSRLGCFEKCPRQFHYRYVERRPAPFESVEAFLGKRVHEILSTHYPAYISPEADRRIRERFPIKLDPRDMKPGNGRWGTP